MKPESNAIVYCENAFNTTTGKTAHGLVRRTARYQIAAVIDSTKAGKDAGEVLDGVNKSIPITATLNEAIGVAKQAGKVATHFVIGLAPIGGRLSALDRGFVREAILSGLNVDSGLHDFISNDAELSVLAQEKGVEIRDIRKTPDRSQLHSFSGKISEVKSFRIALLGTDCAVGKRTTAWCLVQGLRDAGFTAEMVGTGQTAWLQGAKHGIILDSLVNDFVAGELEHAVWSAWNEERPDFIVIEGQGSLLNPAYPGGLEILAATRPEAIVVQHAPARKEYDGFPGFKMQPLKFQCEVLELLSGKPVVAVTINHENLSAKEVPALCDTVSKDLNLPVTDVLLEGSEKLVRAVLNAREKRK